MKQSKRIPARDCSQQHQLKYAIAAHRPGTQRSATIQGQFQQQRYLTCYCCDNTLIDADKPQDFVYSWTAEATTYLFNNKQFPPTLTCEMCFMLLLLTKNKTRTINKGTIIKQTKQLEPPIGGRSLGLLLYSIRRGFLRQRPAC